MEKEILITNQLDEITAIAIFVEELCEELSLTPQLTMHINLALEEAIANIIMYAYPDGEHHEIRLKATFNNHQLVFLLTDKGVFFDPTTAPDVNVTIPIEERPVGGLGIFLIRSIMNEVSYSRLDEENQLLMKKNLG